MIDLRPRVFISSAASDWRLTRQIAEILSATKIHISYWQEQPAIISGESWMKHLHNTLSASDYLLVLLTPESVTSRGVLEEVSYAQFNELRDRSITVVPALVEDCQVPLALADKQILDLRTDRATALLKWADQILVAPEIDFAKLNPSEFERLVADLLLRLDFRVQQMPGTSDTGVDFIASHRSHDPFGFIRNDTWLVQTKLYREERVSVSALRQMLGVLLLAGSGKKGLIVTTGQPTSVAREFLAENIEKTGLELRVIDGAELTSLLVRHPDLVGRYFSSSNADE